MKKFLLILSLFLFFVVGIAADASAKDMSRRFGLGVDSAISSYAGDGRGISAIYQFNKYFGLQLLFGLNTTTATLKEDIGSTDFMSGHKTTIIDWNVSIRGLIPIVMSNDVNLVGVVGFSASGRSTDGFKADTSRNDSWGAYNDGYQFSIDLGVRPEFFLSEHFSIHTQVGIGINIITEGGATQNTFLDNYDGKGQVAHSTKASGVSVDFFKNVDLLGMAGCTFWF